MRRAICLPLIWLALLLVNVAGFFVGLLALVLSRSYGARIFRTQNRSAGAVLGFSGDHAISSECGKSQCWFCKLLCPVLSWALQDPDHCAKEAAR